MSANELINPIAPLAIKVKSVTLSPTGAVTQGTSVSTAVTLNYASGVISCFTSTAAAGVIASFTLNNSLIVAASRVVCSVTNYSGTTGIPYVFSAPIAAGSCTIHVANAATAAALNGVVSVFFQLV